MRISLLSPLVTVLVSHACGSGPASTSRSATTEAHDSIVADWRELEPRLHAVYRGRIDLATGEACASDLHAIVPPEGRAPSRLCTPLADIIAWHTGHATALPTGPSLWIATTWSPAGGERVAVAVAATSGAAALDPTAREALAAQFRCGQLALRWRIRASSQACTTGADCRLFTGACFAATVAVRDAAPYEELHRRWGGTCPDPVGGACPPAGAARCIQSRCTIAVD